IFLLGTTALLSTTWQLRVYHKDVAALADPLAAFSRKSSTSRKNARKMLLGCCHCRRLRCCDCIAARVRQCLSHGVAAHLHDLFGSLELFVSLSHLAAFETQCGPCRASEPAANLRAEWSSEKPAQGAARQGQRFLCHALQDSADRLTNWRLHDLAKRAAGFL